MPERTPPCNARDLTDDALTGSFRVWQRRRGHRYSLDDVVTAWRAVRERPDARSVLDLGTGIGSVLLMLAYKLPAARLVAIEAQRESFELARRNACRNRVRRRLRLVQGDLREADTLESLACGDRGFDLVTGTPPYKRPGEGPVSPDPQRAHARVELRGGVEDYLAAAARVLHPQGRVVVCADAARPERVAAGADAAGLRVLERMDVVPIAGHKRALFSTYVLGPAVGTGELAPLRAPDFVARESDGRRGAQALEVRRFFDLEVARPESPSPRLRRRPLRAMGA